MKRHVSAWSGPVAVCVAAWFATVPASARAFAAEGQDRASAGAPAGGGSSAGASSGGSVSSGSSAGSAGGSTSSGGDGVRGGGVHRGGDDWSRGGHGGATGGSGVAMPRYGGDRSGGSAAPRSGDGHGTNVAGRRTSDDKGDAGRSGKGDVPSWSRPREGHEPVGTAVPRTSPPERRGGGTFGGYVPNYYDPWWLYGAGYGYGYYDPFYDPWYGGYPGYSQTYSSYDEGSLRLKIKPRQAQVYVDGYYVGIVDDFDGIFQRLHIEAGTHRIEVRAPGYEPLTFDVRIEADHTTTYQGELKRLQ